MTLRHFPRSSGERGATAVEFALVAMFLITLILGFVQLGIAMYVYNSAAQATRHGARVAAVNAPYSSAILTEMQYFLSGLTSENVVICYPEITNPSGAYVVVRLAAESEPRNDPACSTWQTGGTPYKVSPWFIWFIDQIEVPPFPTWLPRESLGSG